MRDPLALLEPDAQGTEALLLELPVGLAQRQRLGFRVPALGEIPEPLSVAPPGDGNLAERVQDHEHERGAAASPPRMLLSSLGLLELTRQERAALLELTLHVA